ncbi:cilia- and flagella-associated protein 45 [Takifugu flavidus]|uniref:Cilia- and flagella-associated protein 45 n=1 Tax=Takifugu flavidus TaxID=433684 RepID=A0A5C6PDK8_9TELE|nr:cilia- and flagella-associated protein 45 [Takifugu flavidus]TWW77563.1 Cilia- and flagella-associated protein 45 [Takifugu flavidus]
MSSVSSSRCSRNRPAPRYRTQAASSQVDETLFRKPKPVSTQPDQDGKSASKVKNHLDKKRDRETIQIVTKDLIRTLRIKDPPEESVILPSVEFKRIESMSQVPTTEEVEAQREALQKKKEEEKKASEEMKRRILEVDLSRKKSVPLTDLEREAQDRAQGVVERANLLKIEQDEEIRMLNTLILDAQCQATRDAQIQEKKQIQAELTEEEKRLDAVMETERLRVLEADKKTDKLCKEQRMRAKQQIYEQIQKRLVDKIMQEEIQKLERQQEVEKQEKSYLQDLKALERKKEEQRHLHEENLRINTETIRTKEQRREEEKLLDMRDMEYIKKKLEQEAEYEAEQKRVKKEKELEITRLRAQQERAKDYKAEQDEHRARRHQESVDREWRRKEKELAAKKVEEEAKLKAARLEQVRCKEHLLSMEAGREKAEFERILKVEQEAVIKRQEQEEKQRQRALGYANSIRHQIKEQKSCAAARRKQSFQEGRELTQKEQQRRLLLSEIREKKLQELRAAGLPEIYCSQVERKACTNVQ